MRGVVVRRTMMVAAAAILLSATFCASGCAGGELPEGSPDAASEQLVEGEVDGGTSGDREPGGGSLSGQEAQGSESAARTDLEDRAIFGTSSFRQLLEDMVSTYETPSRRANRILKADLAAIRKSSKQDFEVARAIVNNWNGVYSNAKYRLALYNGGKSAGELVDYGIPDEKSHAFVVLGCALVDGQMQDELRGRCKAAAAASRSYPRAYLVCSGGPTGENNPDGNTEAALMKAYLVEECGVDEARVLVEEQSQSTAENALNTMGVLRDAGLRTITIVTSSYHQRRSQAVFNAATAFYRENEGYSVELIGNYNYPAESLDANYDLDDRVATRQIAWVLGLPEEEIELLPAAE